MKTAIVIPTYNRSLMVERLLINLAQCAFPPNVEIYVVENGPRGSSENVCNANTAGNRVRYLHSQIGGRAKASNFAIQHSGADFFIFFDDDITFPATIVETYVEAAQRYHQGHFFGGPLIADAEAPCPPHLVPYLPASARGRSLADHETEVETSRFDFFFGGNWAAFGADLFKVGLYDENLGAAPRKYSPVGDETELQQRLIAAGVRPIYLPDAFIHHFVGKECYTEKWIGNLRFRYGITDWIIAGKTGQRGYEILSIPLWATGAIAKQNIKLLIARLFGFSIERRTGIKMRIAYLAGWLYAAWTRSRSYGQNRQRTMG